MATQEMLHLSLVQNLLSAIGGAPHLSRPNFPHLAGKLGEPRLFVGPPRAQATQQHFGWPELIAVTDAASAQRAIDEILEQGEGPRGHWKDAHFGQFVEILDEYTQLREANPAQRACILPASAA